MNSIVVKLLIMVLAAILVIGGVLIVELRQKSAKRWQLAVQAVTLVFVLGIGVSLLTVR